MGFEQAFRELESLVERLERGEVGLEESLEAFERGLALQRVCEQALDRAERRVEILTSRDGSQGVESFTPEDT
jgi:exodeoxyribonuclease VII small subunit